MLHVLFLGFFKRYSIDPDLEQNQDVEESMQRIVHLIDQQDPSDDQ